MYMLLTRETVYFLGRAQIWFGWFESKEKIIAVFSTLFRIAIKEKNQ